MLILSAMGISLVLVPIFLSLGLYDSYKTKSISGALTSAFGITVIIITYPLIIRWYFELWEVVN